MTPAAWRDTDRLDPDELAQRPPSARREPSRPTPSAVTSTTVEGARAVLEALLSRDPDRLIVRPEAP